MTVKELKEFLETYPDDMPILIGGHSDGTDFDDTSEISELIVYKYAKRTWSGQYHEPVQNHPELNVGQPINALHIQ